MRTILSISLTALFVTVCGAANAQWFRPYPDYNNGYQRLQQNMERGQNNNNQYTYMRNGNSNFVLNLNYGISQPLGTLKEYADKMSFSGWNAALLYQINPKIAAGLGIGFYDYYQKIPRQVYHQGNTDISAVQSHTLQLIPVQPTIMFTPKGDQPGIQPYIGLGIGVADVNYQEYWGEFVDKQNKIGFSASPMAGIHIPFTKTSPFKLNVGVKYTYAPFTYNEIHNISMVEANVGLSIHLR